MSSIPQSKKELELAIQWALTKIMDDYLTIPDTMTRECLIEGYRKERLISVCDTLAYLIGWGRLVLKWHDLTSSGSPVDIPEAGYKWNEIGLLAEHFYDEYNHWQYTELLIELDSTMKALLSLISSLSNHDLYETTWYNTWTLGRMIQLNTSSPMKNMRIKVRRFKRDRGLL